MIVLVLKFNRNKPSNQETGREPALMGYISRVYLGPRPALVGYCSRVNHGPGPALVDYCSPVYLGPGPALVGYCSRVYLGPGPALVGYCSRVYLGPRPADPFSKLAEVRKTFAAFSLCFHFPFYTYIRFIYPETVQGQTLSFVILLKHKKGNKS